MSDSSPRPAVAVLFDFGRVLTTGPLGASAAYERDRGQPEGLIRQVSSWPWAWARARSGGDPEVALRDLSRLVGVDVAAQPA